MTDFYWPTLLEPAASKLEILDSAGRFQSPLTSYTRTVSRPGERQRLTLSFENTNSSMRAALQAYVSVMRGATHRVWAFDHSNRIRGSFPSSELLPNNTFLNGITGFTVGADYTRTATERVYRSTRNAVTGAAAAIQLNTGTITLTQYASYVFRVMTQPGRGTFSSMTLRAGSTNGGSDYSGAVATTVPGLCSMPFTALGTAISVSLRDTATSGEIAGDFISIPYISLSRCALVDNGPNLLLQSDDFTTTWTNTRSSDAANATAAPDGTTTADSIIEDGTASNTHFISQGVTVSGTDKDYSFAVALKAGTRTFARVVMIESTGSHECYVDVNLTTGALGTPTVTGANWTNPRAFTQSLGNGWFYFCIIGQKVSNGTTLTARIHLASALGTVSYSGDGTSLISAWRATMAQSGQPTRLAQTTTTAVAAGTNQALGGGIFTKGWPVSTDGVLLKGDQVQIGNQIVILTDAVNTDAAGLAFLPFAAVRAAPADNTAVIINQPMGKFFIEPDSSGWSNKGGLFSDAEVVLAEAA